jgi:hypothetical protein
VIIRDGPNGVESSEIVLEWVIVSMPGYDIEGRMFLLSAEECIVKLRDDCPRAKVFVVRCDRGLEVTSICQAIRSDWSKFRKLIMPFVELTYIATYGSVGQRNSISVRGCILATVVQSCQRSGWYMKKSSRTYLMPRGMTHISLDLTRRRPSSV